jgi:hypothetical protein
MQTRLIREPFIAAVVMLHGLVALPLPCLLIDHYSAVRAGGPDHSDADVHAWLEWVASSSLSGTGLVLPSVLLPSAILPIPSVQGFSNLLVSVPYSRGPPVTV